MAGSLTLAQADRLALVIGLAALIEDRDPAEQKALEWAAGLVDGIRNQVKPGNPRSDRVLVCAGDRWLSGPRTALRPDVEPVPSQHRGCWWCDGKPLVPDPPSRVSALVKEGA